MTRIIHIQDGFYQVAGRDYGWPCEDTRGIGIDLQKTIGVPVLRVRVAGLPGVYRLDTHQAAWWVKHFQSIQEIKGKTLWILPWVLFSRENAPPSKSDNETPFGY